MKVIGAGIGRTGTLSLKFALEKILGVNCYHMFELVKKKSDIEFWSKATYETNVDWNNFFSGYEATVDWPSAAYWRELELCYPQALVILSVREANSWWESASNTIFPALLKSKNVPWRNMVLETFKVRFTTKINSKKDAINAFNRHNNEVIRQANKKNLLVWDISDGWEPICKKLLLPIPKSTFPHYNSTADFNS